MPRFGCVAILTEVQQRQSMFIYSLAGIDPVCLVIGIRWVAAKARRPGFSETHGNLEAFILWKRCLVKVQRCSPAPLMTLQFSWPGLETEPCDGYDWWNRDTHTCTHTHASITVPRDGYDWWKLWTLLPESFASFLAGPPLAKLSRVSPDQGWIGLQINRLPVQFVGCVHLLSERSLLFMTEGWRYRGCTSRSRRDEILEVCACTKVQIFLSRALRKKKK